MYIYIHKCVCVYVYIYTHSDFFLCIYIPDIYISIFLYIYLSISISISLSTLCRYNLAFGVCFLSDDGPPAGPRLQGRDRPHVINLIVFQIIATA